MPLNFYQGGGDQGAQGQALQPQSPPDPLEGGAASPEGAPMEGGAMPGMDPMGGTIPTQFDEFGFPMRNATAGDRQADLSRDFSNLHRKSGQLTAKGRMIEEKMGTLREDFVRKVFEMMAEMGVDPQDPASVSQFVASMEKNDPDLVALFETALAGLDPSGGAGEEQAPEMASRMRQQQGMGMPQGMDPSMMEEMPEQGAEQSPEEEMTEQGAEGAAPQIPEVPQMEE